MKSLHDLNIYHRDLKVFFVYRFYNTHKKSANIFLNKDGRALLGDLNVSKLAKRGLLYTQTGTPYYARYHKNSSHF
jgi:NIMA (never in mitosis gene a)-related kinase